MIQRATFVRSAAALGAAAALPGRASAAGKAPVVKIGYLDSFSGVFSDLGGYHKIGATLALEDANRRGRVKYEFVPGDDASKPAEGINELRRLVTQEKVDVIFGGVSSAVGLALGAAALEAGVFNLSIGPQTSAMTTEKAALTTFRFSQNARMFVKALGRRVLALGKKWYFLQADYAFGKDSYAQLSAMLRAAGGTEVGADILPLGTTDFSSAMVKVRNSGADVFVMCNSGVDTANTVKQFVEFGLNKRMHLAGINLEDIYYKAIPLDQIVGATFPLTWSPLLEAAAPLTARLKKAIRGPISSRHYFGYVSLMSLIERIEATGSTGTEKLIAAFSDHAFNGFKTNPSVWRGCDHQCVQDTYAGAIVGAKKFAAQGFMYDVVAEVPAAESDGTCADPGPSTARRVMSAQKIAVREGYTPVSLR